MKLSILITLATALTCAPVSRAAEPHTHTDGAPCTAEHPDSAPPSDAEHKHAEHAEHPEHAEHAEHAGDTCTADHDHSSHTEAGHADHTEAGHEDHSEAEHESHDHDHAAHGHVHAPGEVCTGGDAVIVEADARSRHILNMQIEEVPEATQALTHSMYGYLSAPNHAMNTYALPCAGRLTLHVKSAQQVRKGDILYTLASPTLTEQITAVASGEAALERSREELIAMQERLDRLASAGSRNSELEEQRTFKLAEQRQLERELETARIRLRAITFGGEATEQDGMQVLVVRALHDGIVRNVGISQGSWGEQGAPVLTMSDTNAMEIIGTLYAGNMPRFNQVRATIPVGRDNVTVRGSWRLAEQVDPEKLTRTLYFTPESMPAGVPAGQLCRLDLYDDSEQSQGSIPIPDSAIVKVGVDDVVFVEVAEGKFAMMKVQAGTSRRGMTPVKGLKPGQRIVVKGGYELKYILPGEGAKKKAGHFHADGKFHEGEDH